MKVGIFHPPLNVCGGAELVAINMIKALKESGHQTIVLTNEPVDYGRIKKVFGEQVTIDKEIVFPFQPFPQASLNNIYSDFIRTIFLRKRCDILIDTQSNGLLPGADIAYIHHPIFGRLDDNKTPKSKIAYFLPYHCFERTMGKKNTRLVFSNSKYTSNAIKRFIGLNPLLLYPPISKFFYINNNEAQSREDLVVSVSRISPEKRLTLIPEIAKLTNNRISFFIIGMTQSVDELRRINDLIQKNGLSRRVHLVINVSRPKLIEILRTAKVLLHPARGEHFGMSIPEGMASGCIPIVNDSGGPREFVPDNLRFKTIEDAADKINQVIMQWSPQQSIEIASQAELFNEANFSERFINLFNQYIENKHN